MLENRFQSNLITELKTRFPGCVILKNDPNYIQGFPDLTIFKDDTYAVLECKRSANASARPNQKYYVDKMNSMSFSRFIYPENKDEVINDLDLYFANHTKVN